MLAIAGSLLIPACGGGGGGSGDGVLSAQQFGSGSRGYTFVSYGVMKIVSTGYIDGDGGGVNSKEWTNPEMLVTSEGEAVRTEVSQEWGYGGTVTDRNPIPLKGVMTIGTSSVDIEWMTYEVQDNSFAHLDVVLANYKSSSEIAAEIARFLGVNLVSELDASGNTTGYAYIDQIASRVAMQTPTACKLGIWMNLKTGQAIVQLITKMSYALEWETVTNVGIRVSKWSAETDGPLFTATGVTWRANNGY